MRFRLHHPLEHGGADDIEPGVHVITTQVRNGFISVNPERSLLVPRRRLQMGDRRFGVTGCAPDVFLYVPLVGPSLQVEETCPATGTAIRFVFTHSGIQSVDPPGHRGACTRGDGG